MGKFDNHLKEHSPLWDTLTEDNFECRSIIESSTPNSLKLDDLRIYKLEPPRFRLAVCDPALGLIKPLEVAYVAGQYALDQLNSEESLELLFSKINSALYDPAARRATKISLTCLGAVDWDIKSGEVEAVRAGDCQVFVRSNGVWLSLFKSEILTNEAKLAWANAAPQSNREAHLKDHDRMLGTKEAWLTAPLGQFNEDLIEVARAKYVDGVAISSDGITLDVGSISDLGGAWAKLHNRTENWPHKEPHGDIATLIARLR